MAIPASYSKIHRHFFLDQLPVLLAEQLAEEGPTDVVADLGCGDGAVIWALDQGGLVTEKFFAVDLDPARTRRAAGVSPKVEAIVADATEVPEIADGSVGGVVVYQVIEHLADDRRLAPEIARILRPGGWFFVGSVVRGRRAWWIYRRRGRWWLDPTHLREYDSERSFLAALEHPELQTERTKLTPIRFALPDLVLRGIAVARLLSFDRLGSAYTRWPLLRRLRRLAIPIPGYRVVEAWGRKSG